VTFSSLLARRSLRLLFVCAFATAAFARSALETYTGLLAYRPDPTPTKVKASASLQVRLTVDPEIRKVLGQHGHAAELDSYFTALAQMLTQDIAQSAMFTELRPNSDPKVDYVVSVLGDLQDKAAFRLRVTIEVQEYATQKTVVSETEESVVGIGYSPALTITRVPGHPPIPNRGILVMTVENMKYTARELMGKLKAEVAKELQNTRNGATVEDALKSASLPELLVANDPTPAIARMRNHAIIAAKAKQLPGILRNWKTDQLSDLAINLEQTILDLNHASEVAKDEAQQLTAANRPAIRVQRLRDLSLSFRERIELLKPIGAAVRDEVTNRNR
jgi:hypothetical protein